ncbi:unnamed protein product, partial [Owenia fusiformis]
VLQTTSPVTKRHSWVLQTLFCGVHSWVEQNFTRSRTFFFSSPHRLHIQVELGIKKNSSNKIDINEIANQLATIKLANCRTWYKHVPSIMSMNLKKIQKFS